MSEPAEQPAKARVAQAANLFDLRRIIGSVFLAYGLLLAILGLFASDADVDKAAGVNINLWAGLGMLAFGVLMWAWALLRPLSEELEADDPSAGRARRRRAASTPRRSAHTSAAGGPGSTTSAPLGRTTPGRSSASTDPPKPPPTIRAPAAPASLSASTVRSTSGTDAS